MLLKTLFAAGAVSLIGASVGFSMLAPPSETAAMITCMESPEQADLMPVTRQEVCSCVSGVITTRTAMIRDWLNQTAVPYTRATANTCRARSYGSMGSAV